MYLGRKLLFLFLVPAAVVAAAAALAALHQPSVPLAGWIAGGAFCYATYGVLDWLGDLLFQRVAPVRPPAGRQRAGARRWARGALWGGLAAIALGGVAGVAWLAGLGTVTLLFGLETWFVDLRSCAPVRDCA
ncbi:hypothetical protein [uncultured Massilia sp.]|uniref:hypothetical protein n=1 Tax=uncultured Massilia sp. TaxID=169973 RepID=UPI0025E1680C|nr:hypothetical protein [uncultured Massilia sp.]